MNIVEYILKARDQITPILRNASKAANAVNSSINNVNKSTSNFTGQSMGKIERLNNVLQYLQQRQAKAFDEKNIGKYNVAIKNVNKELQRLNNLPPESFMERMRRANGDANSLTGKFTRLIAVVGGFQAVKGIIKLGADLEQAQIGFEVLLGSAEKAVRMISQIHELAKVTPFEPDALIENAKLMLSFGTSAEKILPNLRMIGDIAMGNKAKMDSLTLAFSQMSSLGKLTGQDLLQMVNAGFNPLKELEKMTGKTYASLREGMEKGAISVEMVESAFKHATSEGGQFYQMMEKMSQTANGKLSTLIGSLKLAGSVIGLKILPFVNRLLDYVMPLADWLGRNADMVLQLTTVLLGAVVAFKLIIGAIKLWTIAQSILNGVMLLNPIGLIIAGVAALIAIIIVAYNKFDKFRGIVNGVWDSFKLLVKFIKDVVVSYVKGLISVFTGLGKIIQSVFTADWDGIKAGAQEVKSGYVNAIGGVAESAKNNLFNIGETFSEGYQRGINSGHKETATDANSFFEPGTSPEIYSTIPQFEPGKAVEGIASSGKRETNISINLNKEMIGQLTINPSTLNEGTDEIKEILIQALAQILNSANRIAFE